MLAGLRMVDPSRVRISAIDPMHVLVRNRIHASTKRRDGEILPIGRGVCGSSANWGVPRASWSDRIVDVSLLALQKTIFSCVRYRGEGAPRSTSVPLCRASAVFGVFGEQRQR
jgi:hypothetical protein